MSRRKPPPPRRSILTGQAVSARPVILIVCTDRGTHPARTSAELTDGRRQPFRTPSGPRAEIAYSTTERKSARHNWIQPDRSDPVGDGRPDGGRTFAFKCALCRRAPQRTEETMGLILDRLYASDPGRDRYRLDVSHLS